MEDRNRGGEICMLILIFGSCILRCISKQCHLLRSLSYVSHTHAHTHTRKLSPPLRVSYDRITWQRAHMTFLLSAFWHGFYPSYYLGLIYLGFLNETAKKVGRCTVIQCEALLIQDTNGTE